MPCRRCPAGQPKQGTLFCRSKVHCARHRLSLCPLDTDLDAVSSSEKLSALPLNKIRETIMVRLVGTSVGRSSRVCPMQVIPPRRSSQAQFLAVVIGGFLDRLDDCGSAVRRGALCGAFILRRFERGKALALFPHFAALICKERQLAFLNLSICCLQAPGRIVAHAKRAAQHVCLRW